MRDSPIAFVDEEINILFLRMSTVDSVFYCFF